MQKPLGTDLRQNLADLNEMFGSSMDLYTKQLCIRGVRCAVCMFDGLSSTEKLWVILLDALSRPEGKEENGWQLYQHILYGTDIPAESGEIADFEELTRRLTAGSTAAGRELQGHCIFYTEHAGTFGAGAFWRGQYPWLTRGLYRPFAD